MMMAILKRKKQKKFFKPGTRGFTLVETLIAVFIGGLLSVSMFWFFLFAQRSQQREMSEFRINRDIDRIESSLQRYVKSATMDGDHYEISEDGAHLSLYSPSLDSDISFFRDSGSNEFVFFDGVEERVLSENITHTHFERQGVVIEYIIEYKDQNPGGRLDEITRTQSGFVSPRAP